MPYIVPTIVTPANADALAVEALKQADPTFWDAAIWPSGSVGVMPIVEFNRTADGHANAVWCPTIGGVLVVGASVTFQTFDSDGPGEDGLFEVVRLRPDGASEEAWVDAADCAFWDAGQVAGVSPVNHFYRTLDGRGRTL
tara:strand:+ start:301 stop:720 length:420 start_codon:yes stop_codon:yes gene_type:complete